VNLTMKTVDILERWGSIIANVQICNNCDTIEDEYKYHLIHDL
jgi:hypothetical protein